MRDQLHTDLATIGRNAIDRLIQAEKDCRLAMLLVHDLPGWPLETASRDELTKWTDAIAALRFVLREYAPK